MNAIAGRRPYQVLFIAALVLLALTPRGSSALADSSPTAKSPEVSTVGTGPYLGPDAAELAKLAQQEASTEAAPTPPKEPAVATISTGAGNILTVAELAKWAAVQTILGTPSVPLMPKLGPMTVAKNGVPDLTAQERDKHARELATPQARPTTPLILPPAQVRTAGSSVDPGSTPDEIAKPNGSGTPAASSSAPRSSR